MAESAIWEPIDSKSKIRLLTIRAAPKQTAPLEIDLASCPNKQPAPYEALSYTWGDARHKEIIRCNDKDLSVTQNCAAALRALRRRATVVGKDTTVLPIWIDAICINQYDLEERNNQVARMAQIFGDARQTIIYLGEPDQHWEFLQMHVLHVLRDLEFIARVDQIAKGTMYDADRARRQHLSELGWEAENLFATMDKSRFRRKRAPDIRASSPPRPVIYEQDIKKHWNGFFHRP